MTALATKPAAVAAFPTGDLLLRDLRDYLDRVGRWGAEYGWLCDQIEFLGHSRERVRAALAVLVAAGEVKSAYYDDVRVVRAKGAT